MVRQTVGSRIYSTALLHCDSYHQLLSAEFLGTFHRFYRTTIQEIVVRRYEPSTVGLIQDRDDPFFVVLIENLQDRAKVKTALH